MDIKKTSSSALLEMLAQASQAYFRALSAISFTWNRERLITSEGSITRTPKRSLINSRQTCLVEILRSTTNRSRSEVLSPMSKRNLGFKTRWSKTTLSFTKSSMRRGMSKPSKRASSSEISTSCQPVTWPKSAKLHSLSLFLSWRERYQSLRRSKGSSKSGESRVCQLWHYHDGRPHFCPRCQVSNWTKFPLPRTWLWRNSGQNRLVRPLVMSRMRLLESRLRRMQSTSAMQVDGATSSSLKSYCWVNFLADGR